MPELFSHLARGRLIPAYWQCLPGEYSPEQECYRRRDGVPRIARIVMMHTRMNTMIPTRIIKFRENFIPVDISRRR